MPIRDRCSVFLGAVLALFLSPVSPLLGQTAQPEAPGNESKIDLSADSLSVKEKGELVDATGNVEMRREEMILKADELRLNRATQDVEVRGKVSVDGPEWKLKAEAAQMNLERETGVIEQGNIFFESGHLTASGRRMEKFGGQTYHIDEGFFTTCLCDSGPPSWKITAEEIDLHREGEGIIRRGTFYIMDIPLLYLPYASFPLKTERQTGLLFPKIGNSSKDGFRFQQPYFWAISKSSDASFGVDVESRSRIGALGELRTIFSRDAQAQINLSYFNEGLRKNAEASIVDSTIADPEIPKNRWSVMATHRQGSSENWLTYSDIAAFSDDLFTRELSDRVDFGPGPADIRTIRYSRSRAGFFKGWVDSQLRGEWDFYQDFIQKDGYTFQRVPQVLWNGRRILGETPLEFRWRAEGVNYVRREGADGLRLDLRPELLLPFQMFPYFMGSFDLALRETAYHLYQTEGSFERNKTRELVELRGNVGTSLARVFDWNGSDLKKIRHVLEPELSYLFIPSVQQRDIPIMDGVDRINRRNMLTFSLTNRLWGKYPQPLATQSEDRDVELLNSPFFSDVRELGMLRLALSYDINNARNGGDSLSDLDMKFRHNPLPYLGISVDTGLHPGPWQITQTTGVLSLSDPRPLTRQSPDPDFVRPNSMSLSYRFIRNGPNAYLADNANINLDAPADCTRNPTDPRCPGTAFQKNIVGAIGWNLLYHVTDHILFFYNSSYDLRESRFPGYRGAIKILSQCECWTLTFSLKRDINPARTSFGFDFSLLGLGSQRSTLR